VPDWAKIVTLIIGLGGYSATVIATLWQGKIPDIGTLGIPAALILALAPPIRIGRRRAVGTAVGRRGAAAADEPTADEGDSA
jgi:hypothetical protein